MDHRVSEEQRARVAASLAAGMASRIPHNAVLGLEFVEHGPNEVRMRLPFRPELVGDPTRGGIHSGAIASLMDVASGFAVMITIGGFEIATLDLRLDTLAPAPPGEDLFALAECYHASKHVCFARGYAYAGDPKRPVATVAATFARTGGAT